MLPNPSVAGGLSLRLSQICGVEKCGRNLGPTLHFVRWRKSRWMPTAKTKLFRIPQRPNPPEDEHREIRRLYEVYRTHIKSLRVFLEEKQHSTNVIQENQLQSEEEAEHLRLMEENRQENERMAALREARAVARREALEAAVMLDIQEREKEEEERLKNAAVIIQQQQEITRSYLPREQIEQAVESAMASPAVYDFAVNVEGYVVRGRDKRHVDLSREEMERLTTLDSQ